MTMPKKSLQPSMDLVRAGVNRHLAGFLAEAIAKTPHAPGFTPLFDDLAEFVLRPGKRIRPLIYLAAARFFQPDNVWLAPSRLACAGSLELLHAFILIHDDIIDRSELRRGEPSLHKLLERRTSTFSDRQRIGSNLALVMGDVLFAMGQRCLLESGEPKAAQQLSRLLGYIIETGVGEASDIVFGTRDVGKIDLDDIELMYLQKTTRYTIEAPLVLAAILGDATEEQLKELAVIAEPAGLAFQIQNDLEEFRKFEVSDEAISSDLLEGKKTCLMRTAFEMLNETDQGILQLCLNGIQPSEATASKVRELVIKSGATLRLQNRVETLCSRSLQNVCESSFDASIREGLEGIITMLCQITKPVSHEVAV